MAMTLVDIRLGMSRIVIISLLLAACGCDLQDETLDQSVTGIVLSSTNQGRVERVLLAQRTDGKCTETNGVVASVAEDGRFALRRTVNLGKLAVVVQDDTLCLWRNGSWVKVWRSKYGPAASSINIRCIDGVEGWACVARAEIGESNTVLPEFETVHLNENQGQ